MNEQGGEGRQERAEHLARWDALPVNSEPLAPLEPYRGETKGQFLVRAARHYAAREAALTKADSD